RLTAAGQRFALPAQSGKIRSRTATILKNSCLAHPEVHDAALVDEVVADALDETGMGGRLLVSRCGPHHLFRRGIDAGMSLSRAVDAIGPVEAGVEPLRRIGGGHLCRQHVARLVVKRVRVRLRREILSLPTPVRPTAGQPMENLAGVYFLAGARV